MRWSAPGHRTAEGTERVILFGSLARRDFDGASDAALMVTGGDGRLDTGIWDAVGERGCKIARGGFTAVFLLQGMAAIGAKEIRLD